MGEEWIDVDGNNELKEILNGIIDAIEEIAEDSHPYLIIDGRINSLKAQAKSLKLNIHHYTSEED